SLVTHQEAELLQSRERLLRLGAGDGWLQLSGNPLRVLVEVGTTAELANGGQVPGRVVLGLRRLELARVPKRSKADEPRVVAVLVGGRLGLVVGDQLAEELSARPAEAARLGELRGHAGREVAFSIDDQPQVVRRADLGSLGEHTEREPVLARLGIGVVVCEEATIVRVAEYTGFSTRVGHPSRCHWAQPRSSGETRHRAENVFLQNTLLRSEPLSRAVLVRDASHRSQESLQ